MPTYQYKCPNDHFYEEERSIKDKEPILICTACSEEMKRTYQVPVVNLMGRGFYRNGG
jgi:putative FmdB family regulatory protein